MVSLEGWGQLLPMVVLATARLSVLKGPSCHKRATRPSSAMTALCSVLVERRGKPGTERETQEVRDRCRTQR